MGRRAIRPQERLFREAPVEQVDTAEAQKLRAVTDLSLGLAQEFSRRADEETAIKAARAGTAAGQGDELTLTEQNTIAGQAFDAAAVRTFLGQQQLAAVAEVSRIEAENRHDPVALGAALAAYRQGVSSGIDNENARLLFEANFQSIAHPAKRRVQKQHEANVLSENIAVAEKQGVAFVDGITSAARSLGAGGEIEDFEALVTQLDFYSLYLDDRVEQRTLTAQEAGLMRRAARALSSQQRILGMADDMTPEEVDELHDRVKADIQKADSGNFATNMTTGMDPGQKRNILGSLNRVAGEKRARRNAVRTEAKRAETERQSINYGELNRMAIDGTLTRTMIDEAAHSTPPRINTRQAIQLDNKIAAGARAQLKIDAQIDFIQDALNAGQMLPNNEANRDAAAQHFAKYVTPTMDQLIADGAGGAAAQLAVDYTQKIGFLNPLLVDFLNVSALSGDEGTVAAAADIVDRLNTEFPVAVAQLNKHSRARYGTITRLRRSGRSNQEAISDAAAFNALHTPDQIKAFEQTYDSNAVEFRKENRDFLVDRLQGGGIFGMLRGEGIRRGQVGLDAQADFNMLVRDAAVILGADPTAGIEEYQEFAIRGLEALYGVNDIDGGGKRVMKFAPSVTARVHGGKEDRIWQHEQLYNDLAERLELERGGDWEDSVELRTTPNTPRSRNPQTGQPEPLYQVWLVDRETGAQEPARDKDNQVLQFFFDTSEAEAILASEEAQKQFTRSEDAKVIDEVKRLQQQATEPGRKDLARLQEGAQQLLDRIEEGDTPFSRFLRAEARAFEAQAGVTVDPEEFGEMLDAVAAELEKVPAAVRAGLIKALRAKREQIKALQEGSSRFR